MLTPEKISENWIEYKRRVNEYFPERKTQIKIMLDEMEEQFVFAPASSFEYFHNAFPGGYIDHVLRVDDNFNKIYDLYKECGLEVSNFKKEEGHFAAFHHDLGKVGLPGISHYIPNDSKWHIENQGKMYKTNDTTYKMNVTDRAFYLLNHYGIKYSVTEMIGIKCTDGLYEEVNKEYLAGFGIETKLRNALPYMLHQADIMAFRFEFERWAKKTGKFNLSPGFIIPSEHIQVTSTGKSQQKPSLDIFDDMFKV